MKIDPLKTTELRINVILLRYMCDDICKCCLTERGGRGGEGKASVNIWLFMLGLNRTDESIEGLEVWAAFYIFFHSMFIND